MAFNKLTNQETERLDILTEELGEVIQIISKIKRHGYESYHPLDKDKISNRKLLEKELGDVLHAVRLMNAYNDLCYKKIKKWYVEKVLKIIPYLHHTHGLNKEKE